MDELCKGGGTVTNTRSILPVLERATKVFPQLRLGQLLLNAIGESDDLYFVDDGILEVHLRQYMARATAKVEFATRCAEKLRALADEYAIEDAGEFCDRIGRMMAAAVREQARFGYRNEDTINAVLHAIEEVQ